MRAEKRRLQRVLFVCGKARMRSPTAAHVAAELYEVETDFAGLSQDADEPVTMEHIDWADLVVVMEKRQISRLKTRLGALPAGKTLTCLGIPDNFAFLQPELMQLLEQKLPALMTKMQLRHR